MTEWYHVFVGEVEGWFGEGIGVMTLGPGKDPADISNDAKILGYEGFPYWCSLDHEPTDDEKDAIREEWGAAHGYEANKS